MRGPRGGRGVQQDDVVIRVLRFAFCRVALCLRLSMGHRLLAICGGGIERARNNPLARTHLACMEECIEAGRTLPSLALSNYEDQERWEREVYPLLRLYRPFGNFSELNFAQVGHGIGYYRVSP